MLIWEIIEEGRDANGMGRVTDRASVPGGWLVRTWFQSLATSSTGQVALTSAMTMVFMPDLEHTWRL